METVRTVWVGFDEYLGVLKDVEALFRWRLPEASVLRGVLEREMRARHVLDDLGEQERTDLALEVGLLPDWFVDKALELAQADRRAEAEALVQLADVLHPAEAGISLQVLRAQTGHFDEAVAALIAQVRDESKRRYSRLCALEALNDIGALHEFVGAAFWLAQSFLDAGDYESAWCAVNTVDGALLEVIEESGRSWPGSERGRAALRQ
ncbi:MAG: hypothetical protein IRZ16_08955 [Myxococcaceae bacterium]|nr:hypothetical protein [Myxococcaceae bacterium]